MAQIIKDPAPILNLMASQGLSQTKLGQLVGLDSSEVSLSLNGKREVSLHELVRIASVLGADWHDLLCVYGVEAPTPPRPTCTTDMRLQKLEEQMNNVFELFWTVGKCIGNSSLPVRK